MASWDSIESIAAAVQSGSTTALEQVERALRAIEEGKEYQAIISTISDRAIEQAKMIDARIVAGEKVGSLAGVPFIAKDNFLTFGSETTAASNMLRGFKAPYQSTAINRLEAAGAICVAKANLDAFAHGSSTENSDYMTTKNPVNPAHVPGGSSGGSAAAVVLGMAPFALGTDTGGSIRLPASFCGTVGLKPSYGIVSRSGVVAMASSTDCIGPLANSVADAQLVLSVMAGRDELDSTTIESDIKTTVSEVNPSQLKVGVVKEFMTKDVDSEVRKAVQAKVDALKSNGVQVVEVSLPSLTLALACYYVLVPAEISSNLSRYDGQRFEHIAADAKDLEDSYVSARSEGFGREAKRRIMIGTYVLSSGYYDAYYKRAQLVRTKIIKEFEAAFEKVDALVGPVAPAPAFKLGDNVSDPMQMYLGDVMTVGASLAGIPAISIPAGKNESGLPIGLQIMAGRVQDNELLALAKYTEGVPS